MRPPLASASPQQNPLNRAALLILRKAGSPPSRSGVPILDLPLAILDPADERLPVITDWASTPEKAQAALDLLSKALTPDELTAGTPEQAAGQVADELQTALNQDLG